MKKRLLAAVFVSMLAVGTVTTATSNTSTHAQSVTPASTPIKRFATPPFDAYKISMNDTLFFIGSRYGVTVNKLMQLNPNIDPYNMQPGEIVILRINSSDRPDRPVTEEDANRTFEQQVASLVNQERATHGLSPLRFDAELSNMAEDKAIDLYENNYFDHHSPTFGSPFDMMDTYNISYRAAGENIAKGQRTPQEVMDAWMNSPGHRANILNTHFNTIGVGYYHGVWVQAFIQTR